MEIHYWNVEKLIPYARNARKISTKAIDKVAASLQEFGWKQPIVAEADGTVICGHTRLLAAKKIGQVSVPILIATDLTPTQIKAYRLMDNRSHEEATWDDELLSIELTDLASDDFELALTGFDEDEIGKLLETQMEGLTDENALPEEVVKPVSVLGDIWVLGNHRLMCGSSTSADNVSALLDGVAPNLMVTDPPYGVNYDPTWRDSAGGEFGNGKTKMRGKVENDNQDDWSEAWSLFPGNIAYVWHSGLHSGVVADSLLKCGLALRAQIIWVKQHFAMSRGDYHWQHEPCWYAVRAKAKGQWAGDRKQTTIWNITSMNAAGAGDRGKENIKTAHGTQKPVECMKRPIENNSNPGQAVYEPFSGSGTTIIAAEQTNRHCYAMELSPAYVDMAIIRWQNFTGKQAVHAVTGEGYESRATTKGN